MNYNHWFWNSWFMDKVETGVIYLSNFIWSKKYGKR